MSYQGVSHVSHETFSPGPPGFYSNAPPPPPPRPGYDEDYPTQGYQGYLGGNYPSAARPPPPQHCQPGPPRGPGPFEQYGYEHGNGCSSLLRACLAALCCCCVMEECCG